MSIQNIRRARAILQARVIGKLSTTVLGQLLFTIIEVTSEDLAFRFFDTQNNRGVPLKATGLLKAFHLRAIKSDRPTRDEALQESCARRWESIQVGSEDGKVSREHDFAPELFHYYLWRARNWRGQNVIKRETHKEILATFQYQSIKTEPAAKVPLYSGANTGGGSRPLAAQQPLCWGCGPHSEPTVAVKSHRFNPPTGP